MNHDGAEADAAGRSAAGRSSAAQRPLQNRVLPTGEVVSHPARGLLMGNRGCLHGRDRALRTARWRSKAWICCVLEWRGRRRDPMPPGRWTALFFLDEATALAAGHRPCGYCRRADYLAYAHAWQTARRLPERPKAVDMDARLHLERVDPRSRRKRTRPARIAELPDGAMVRYGGGPALVLGGAVLPWTFSGYLPPTQADPDTTVDLLTPQSTVAVLAAGYQPLLHPSANHTISVHLGRPPRLHRKGRNTPRDSW